MWDSHWWLADDIIKIIMMQIKSNRSQILISSSERHALLLNQISRHLDQYSVLNMARFFTHGRPKSFILSEQVLY